MGRDLREMDLSDSNVKRRFEEAFKTAKIELDASWSSTAFHPYEKQGHWIWVIFPQDDGGGKSAAGLGFAISGGRKYGADPTYLHEKYEAYVEQLKKRGHTYFDTWRGLMLKILNGEMQVKDADEKRVNYVTEKVGRDFLKRLASPKRVSGQSLPGSLSTSDDANPDMEAALRKALRVSREEAAVLKALRASEEAALRKALRDSEEEAALRKALRVSREEAAGEKRKQKRSEVATKEECDCGFSASLFGRVSIRW